MTKGKYIVLVGGTGSGKSATGNSILNRQEFVSEESFDKVTTTCQLGVVPLQDGTYLYVIDTPGLFDATTEPEVTLREIARCITMALDGLHAILLVFSLSERFTKQHEAIVEALTDLFGESILDYTILVFTGADKLERTGKTLDQDLSSKRPPPQLKNLLEKCGDRRVAFNNITDDVDTKERQRQQLIDLVGKTVLKNGGNPYSDPKIMAIKNANSEKQIQQLITEMVERKLKAADEKKFKKYEEEMQKLQKVVDSQGKQSEEAKNEILKLGCLLEAEKAAADARVKKAAEAAEAAAKEGNEVEAVLMATAAAAVATAVGAAAVGAEPVALGAMAVGAAASGLAAGVVAVKTVKKAADDTCSIL